MKDITLLVLAGGLGSRYGGLKQIEPFGPNGEFIIDYSVYDAKEAGFTKVVFLIKEDIYETFKETIGSRIGNNIKVEYAFQKNDNLPEKYQYLKDRNKPFGTAHAILCTKDKINEPFMMINADDFYGKDAFVKGAQFLKENENQSKYGLIGYLTKNTLTEAGSVKRGVCEVNDNYLTKITESKVERIGSKIIATPLDKNLDSFEADENSTVSMNMLLFNPSIFSYLEKNFESFMDKNKDDLDDFEYLIPDVLFKAIKENYATCEVIPTTAVWHGVTYKEDAEDVKNAINEMIKEGIYPVNLWK